jgi:hypothetical protein
MADHADEVGRPGPQPPAAGCNWRISTGSQPINHSVHVNIVRGAALNAGNLPRQPATALAGSTPTATSPTRTHWLAAVGAPADPRNRLQLPAAR